MMENGNPVIRKSNLTGFPHAQGGLLTLVHVCMDNADDPYPLAASRTLKTLTRHPFL